MSHSALRIVRITTDKALDRFVDCVYTLRRDHHHWVPPLRRDQRLLVDRLRHPFHQHATVEYFLAHRGGKIVGRIAAIDNHAHNLFHEEKVGFFGFLDAVPEKEVFAALLRTAERWAARRGLTALRGPCSFSTNEECGLLVEGFDPFPTVMTSWNPPTWPALVEAAGYSKAKDLYNWWIDETIYDDRISRVAERVRDKMERKGESITIRPLHMKRFEEELGRVRDVYNAAWSRNWGFVPMTEAEIGFMAKALKPIIVPELVRFLEIDGVPAAFSLSLPDYNIIVRHFRGKLGIKQLTLFAMLRGSIRQMRMLTMGVKSEYRNRGLEALLIASTIAECRQRGIIAAELGWILEDNDAMNRTIQATGARCYRVHRIYEKSLGSKP